MIKQAKKRAYFPYLALAFVLMLAVLLTFSGAWFTDSAKYEGNNVSLRFGTVSASISPSLSFTPTELLPGNNSIVRNVSITNTGNVASYIRFSCDILCNGEQILIPASSGDQPAITYTVNNAWTLQSDNKYFYGSVNAGATVVATITFSINPAFGKEFDGQSFSFTLTVNYTQVANQKSTYSDIVW